MEAVVYKGACEVAVEAVEDARLDQPTDAVVRVTSAAICGSDLHMYEGRSAAESGTVLGHEIMGVVEQVGDAVRTVEVGQRVVMPFNISCGWCANCARGYTSACLVANAENPHAGYGYAAMGPFRGGQAAMVTVPFADENCLPLPGEEHDEWEDDFILLADVFPTGYHGAELAQVGPGDTVAVWGAGPVGLMAAYSSLIRGASEVYVVDGVASRLEKAAEIGAIPIDFTSGDPVEQIFAERKKRAGRDDALTPGEDKMPGVMCGIEAVGYQARDEDDVSKESPTQTIDDLVRVVNTTGRIGIVGVWFPEDPGGVDEPAKHGRFELPLGMMFEKGFQIGMGQCPVKTYQKHLRDLIIAGRAKPSFLVSHDLSLEDAADAYRRFDRREEGWTKIILKPNGTNGARSGT